jgi:predicted xylan-binding protein with Ca-dependent carbohydrate-binding module/uncharacterized protein DUF4214
MADALINGTTGNDLIQASSGGIISLVVNATSALGVWPLMNVLVNGGVAMSGISVTANYTTGATQLVTVSIPAGTTVTSVGIEFTNDGNSPGYTEDRNLYLTSVKLNGVELPFSSSTYVRTFDGSTITGQAAMKWGGTLTYTGSAVTSAAALASGSLLIDGLAGIDTAAFSGTRASYSFGHTATGYLLGTTELVNVERAQFADTKLALDMTGNAGTAAELISAVFGSTYLGSPVVVGLALSLLDGGMSATQLAGLAIQTSLFQQLAGSSSNTDFVRLVYRNVVGVDPNQQQLNTFVGLLDSNAVSKAQMAVIASDTSLNAVHLVGVMQNGIEFA